ncbi:hypothetical protein PP634_gp84 [Arthrobacter phage Richie]|uniref:Uncharacterized protein n=1 Tax=Arthrobacter phage Richie TaxID=2419967 RepID=A0A3G2KJ47_9CAUD|nr:hypothetical protein PP634_gp84 [Arthrobacter phage Richie]AYN58910.1 hypothetical protein PBI_RICHIE_84 [Arthrobacter phage Richie]
MITESQAKALAVMLHEIRPRWSAPAMVKVFERNHTHPAPFPDIAAAAVNAARDPVVETPGCIFTDPRFWPAEAKAHLPKPTPCPDHIGEAAHNCRCCKADVKAGIRPPDMIGKHHEPESEDDE